ncbi:DUF6603 domain-containing protein [Paenibacillus kobensis]|uniref:DUF6603 domain-containing protein n=1 Tax=Paenibacillus kobensis TaxID=59841 RepID=UPI000FDC7A21|nr:DUF6603 domain-containing protein [Paenibacillus kobensis]
MNTTLLNELHARLPQTPGFDLALSPEALQSDIITSGWTSVFGTDTLRLAGANVQPVDPSGNWFIINGTTAVLGMSELHIAITFFVSHDASAPNADTVHCLIEPANLPDSWNIAAGYPELPDYINYSPDQIALGQQESFFKQIDFRQMKLIYSSYDFYAADQSNKLSPPARFTTSLGEPRELLGALLRQGTNFNAQVTLEGDFWSALEQFLPGLNEIGVYGNIAASGDLGLVLRIGHSFQNAQTGAFPEVELLSRPRISASLRQLILVTGLGAASDIGPGMGIYVRLGGDEIALDLGIELPVGSSNVTLIGQFEDGKAITLDEIEKAFGMSDLVSHLPDDLHFFGELGLQFVRATISLSPIGLTDLSVGIGTEYPWTVVDELIYLQPTLTFHASYADGQAAVGLELDGAWQVGTSTIDMYASTVTGEVGAQLAIGETLEIGEMFEELFPGMEVPDIEVRDLELAGNYKTKTIEFEVEVGSDWTFDVGGKPIGLTDLRITAEYDGSSADGEDTASFTGSVIGTLTVAGYTAEVDVELGEQLSIEINLPEVPVSDLVNEFFQVVHLPYQMPAFTLEDFDVRLVPKTGEFNISGGSKDEIDIVHGFGFTLSHFEVQRDAARNQSASIDLILKLGSESVACSAAYHVEQNEITPGTGGSGSQAPVKEWVFKLSMEGESVPVGHLLSSLQGMVGLDYPLPVDDINLRDLYLSFNLGADSRYFVLSGAVFNGDTEWGKCSLIAQKQDTPAKPAASWDFAFSVQIDLNIGLADLPIVGSQLASVTPMKLHAVQFTAASRDYTADEVGKLLQLLPPSAVKPAAQPIGKSPVFQALLETGGTDVAMAVPFKTTNDPNQPAPPVIPPDPVTNFRPAPPTDQTKWFPVNKSFSAVALERVGLRFSGGKLILLLDGSVSLGPFRLGLLGLGAGSPLSKFEPSFNLDGLNIGYQTPELTIDGGFLRIDPDTYAGQVQLQAAAFGITAFGQYGKVDGHPSLFIFGMLEAPLGGPPYFFIEGLAAGFGYNSSLNLPPVTGLSNFSMIKAVMPGKSSIKPTDDPSTVLRQMGTDIQPQYGEYWLAAGIRFSTFEQLRSFALVTAEFGQKLEIALLGVSQLTVPSLAPNPIVYCELGLEASIDPAGGVFAVDASLQPGSYVLSNQCKITGGFAMRVWFGGDHKDDFVVTLGGYHPHFDVPLHYPKPARLSLTWQISDNMGIKGSVYFALTSTAVMAGGSLEAVWQSGDIRAWFNAMADFLLYWKPFRYEADIRVQIGVSVKLKLLVTTVTVTVHAGVDLTLHGPDFGGAARIDLSIVSFTIRFGADKPKVNPISWSEFKSTFLPPPDTKNGRSKLTALAATAPSSHEGLLGDDPGTIIPTDSLVSIKPAAGMLKDLTRTPGYEGDLSWVVSPEKLVLTTATTIPAKTAFFNGTAVEANSPNPWASDFGVVPAAAANSNLSTAHRIAFSKLDPSTGTYKPYGGVNLSPQLRNVPGSLWAYTGHNKPGLGDPATVEDALVGFTIVPRTADPDVTCDVDMEKLLYAHGSPDKHYEWPESAETANPYNPVVSDNGSVLTYITGGQPIVNRHFVLSGMLDEGAAARRSDTIAAMQARGMKVDGNVDLQRMGTDTMLSDWPLIRPLGGTS